MKSEKISIIFPIFGSFDVKRLFLAVESVKIQDYPNIEIVVSEQNTHPTYKEKAREQGVKYVYSKIKKNEDFYNIGYVRNVGIKDATGKYLYLNDSDIIFLRKSFLSNLYKLYKKKKPSYLLFPPMKRLIKSQLTSFYERVQKNGLFYEIKKLNFPDGYTTNRNKTDKLKVLKYGYYKKKYTIPLKDFKKIGKKDLEKYGYGLLFFTYHAGAVFVERKKVITVGGYCQNYHAWGYEDVDLQIKLNKVFKTKHRMSIPKTKNYDVLHLDDRNNFSKKGYDRNTRIFKERMEGNFIDLARRDKKVNKF